MGRVHREDSHLGCGGTQPWEMYFQLSKWPLPDCGEAQKGGALSQGLWLSLLLVAWGRPESQTLSGQDQGLEEVGGGSGGGCLLRPQPPSGDRGWLPRAAADLGNVRPAGGQQETLTT